jgi:hypothetical protein
MNIHVRTFTHFISEVQDEIRCPLILTLHGSDRDGLSLVEKWKDIADQEGFNLRPVIDLLFNIL